MNILIAEDDNATRSGITLFLSQEGHTVTACDNGQTAFDLAVSGNFDLILTDDKIPRQTGLELLAALIKHKATTPLMLMTAFANVDGAVQALKLGAVDYLTKPLNLDELHHKILRIQSNRAVEQENRHLKERIKSYEAPDIIGNSPQIRQLRELLGRIAAETDAPVMIFGESGTGKELVARTLHNQSLRAEQPFVAVNCSAFQESLLESELFGHCKGAFTGAFRDKQGIFKQADKGTLFLDEIGDMSLTMQPKLLRALQEQTIQPVGCSQTETVDVRIICASNRNLEEMVSQGTFREDLFYRLNVVEVVLPPLRERTEDIPLLIQHLIQKHASDKTCYFHPETIQTLQQYAWPGNIRELENLIRLFLATIGHKKILPDDLPEKMKIRIASQNKLTHQSSINIADYKQALQQSIDAFETLYFAHHLKQHGYNISQTASAVGISRAALHQKIKKLNLSEEAPNE